MVEAFNIINSIACVGIFIFTALTGILFFSNNNSIVYQWGKFKRETIRLGLICLSLGTLYTLMSYDHPPKAQILMNIGLGIVMTWVYFFHYYMFHPKKNDKN